MPPLWRKSSGLAEVVGVGLDLEADRRGRKYVVGEAVLVAIGDGGLLRGEGEANLRPRVPGAVPAGQRIGPLRLLPFELEKPLAGLGLAGLRRLALDFGNAGSDHCGDVAKSGRGIKGAARPVWCEASPPRSRDRLARDVSDIGRASP